MTNIAWSFNTLPPTSRWFCEIKIWSALREKLLYERSETIWVYLNRANISRLEWSINQENICLDEDALKTYFVFVFVRRFD